MVADEIINIEEHTCKYGHTLGKINRCIIQQKIDIPAINPYVKEYRRWYNACPACKKPSLAPLPGGVEAALLGNHAKTIISPLNGYFHNSKREVDAILKDVFNLAISLGLICNTTKRVRKILEKPYQALQREVLASPYVHIDETGHRHKGERGWAWIVTSKQTSVLKLSHSRGKKVLEEQVGKYSGCGD